MTITAGFVHRDGIILCSDTQQETGSGKYHGPKVGFVDIPFGRMAFAIAGNSDFAISAIQTCCARLQSVGADETVDSLKAILDEEYRRLVFTHASYGHDPYLAYWFLIALWENSSGECSLWVTQDHSLHSSYSYFRAVGIGTDLANIIARPFEQDVISESDALTLMAYMMARIKDNVPGCGGISQYISVRRDGSTCSVVNIGLEEIEKVSALYDKEAHRLLLAMNGTDDSAFDQSIQAFVDQAKLVRGKWKTLREANPEVRRYLRFPTAEPKP